MAKIRVEQAPSPRVPLCFLLTAPAWGVVAGFLLAVGGESLLLSRWAPGTLALVHALTLGVLGNSMIGSLLQFLPAAAGAMPAGGAGSAYLLHALLNAGTASLLAGFWWTEPMALSGGALLLTGAFVLLAAVTLPALLRANAQRLLTVGIALAIGSAVVTAVMGALMALGLAGHGDWALPLLPWADVHASWGLLGWAVVLLASVGRVVMPMFQGTAPLQETGLVGWLVAVFVGLLAGSVNAPRDGGETLRWVAALCGLAFALEALWRQLRRPRPGTTPLLNAWRAGLAVLVAAALAVLLRAPAVTVGMLVIAIAVPLLVVGMQMEIVAFLGWIELRRSVPRGTRIPGVNLLLPARDKSGVIAMFGIAGALLMVAAAWPQAASARVAGVALMGAYLALSAALAGVGRRSRGFS
ncbi:hypothetical protein [Lysobacter sp. A3-1-A15]|uniref:hypothetical protein n=1 Tax=Novilysobacter viscosus TaxID=3098602 RepID=UPI002EDB749A